jgi:hypothetical protein
VPERVCSKVLSARSREPGLPRGNQEELARLQEPPSLEAGESQHLLRFRGKRLGEMKWRRVWRR